MWTIFIVFIEFVTLLNILFYVLVFGESCGIWIPRPGIEPTPSALEGKVLTLGPPGKSLFHCFGAFRFLFFTPMNMNILMNKWLFISTYRSLGLDPGNGTIGLEGTSRVCSFTQMSSGFQKDSTAPAISGNACFSVLARPEDRVVQTGHECQEWRSVTAVQRHPWCLHWARDGPVCWGKAGLVAVSVGVAGQLMPY